MYYFEFEAFESRFHGEIDHEGIHVWAHGEGRWSFHPDGGWKEYPGGHADPEPRDVPAWQEACFAAVARRMVEEARHQTDLRLAGARADQDAL